MSSNPAIAKACLKCGHSRSAQDPGPDYACPACGAVYAKVEAAMAERRAREAALAPVAAAEPATGADDEVGPELQQFRAAERNRVLIAHLVYLLYVLPLGFTAIAGVVTAHVAASNAGDSWIGSHFRWQVRTFWISLLGTLVLLALGAALLGAALFAFKARGTGHGLAGGMGAAGFFWAFGGALALWTLWRIAKGWYRLVREEDV